MKKFWSNLINNAVITLIMALALVVLTGYLLLIAYAVINWGFLGAIAASLVTLIIFTAIDTAVNK